MAYLGIEFLEKDGGGLALVSSNWLTPRKKQVWWPPFKNQEQFDKSLKKGETPDETWDLYGIFKSYFEEEDYKKAAIKLKKAEITSDIQSEQESEIISVKRKIIPPKRLLFSSDEESDIERDVRRQLPKVKGISPLLEIKRKKFHKSNSGDETSSCVTLTSQNQEKHTLLPRSDVRKENVLGGFINEKFRTPQQVVQTRQITDTPLATSNEDRDFKKQIITLLVQVKNQNNEILKFLQDKQTGDLLPLKLPSDIPVQLPLENLREVEIIEEYLSVENKLSAVSSYCSKLGGRDVTSKTNTILRNLLSNNVGSQYSFLGSRQHKRAFVKLNLRKVVLNAILATCQTNEKEVDNNIKNWLKHAPKRLLHQQKKDALNV